MGAADSQQSESRGAAGASSAASRPAGILDAALEIARRDHPALDAAAVASEIDRLAARLRERAPASASAADRIGALRAVLFEDAKLEAVAALDSPETLHVDSVLRDRRGYCLSISIVALSLAERAGLPLRGVALPNHFLVRYDDGRARRNLELTRGGAEISDEELRAKLGSAWREDSIYLRDLTTPQIRAFLLHNRGFVAMLAGKKKEAAADFREALRLVPDLPEAHRNLGVLLGEGGMLLEAKAEFDRALQLYAADADALVNRAVCRQRLGDFAGALADADVALLLDPRRKSAADLREQVRHELREHDWPAWQKLVVAPLDKPPAELAPGLDTRFYRGIDLKNEVARRVDREVDFDWKSGSPERGVPADGFSTRLEGWFRAPKDGNYSLFVVSNDGARLTLDEKVLLESWQEQGWQNWFGTTDVKLLAGWHRIRLEHFEARGGARLLLRIGVDGEERPLKQADCLFH